ncbi:hypothetical protein [uncultured Winogradskyella sp.]|uniref:hypothetical protein n=1 Tax=uncultured Winogradskyella sp. TaxID=395353 RepID=UPI002618CD79|nr:hypothetical protein [uncultured Winogradskyella sp.]
MKLKPLLLINLLLLIFSCSNESLNTDDGEGENQDDVLIKQINYSIVDEDVEFTIAFNYNDTNLTSIIDSASDLSGDYSATFEYANNNLVRVNFLDDTDLEEYVILTYNSEGLLTEFTNYLFDIDGENIAIKHMLTYDENNSNVSLELFRGDFSSQTENIGITNYTITNGNITEISHNSGDTVSFQYDSKNSAYKNIYSINTIALIMNESENGFEMIFGSGNNVTQKIDDQGDFVDTETTSYTYNSDDYPNTAMYFYDGELDSNIEFIYE